jgi:hypothetical protein
MPKLDAYNFRARLLAAIVASGAFIAAAALLVPWTSFGLPHVLAGVLCAAVFVALADIARRRGVRVQADLFKRWGGAPSTIMLRDSDNMFDAETKRAYREFLATKVKGGASTSTEPAVLDAFYDRCCTWLRENTRNRNTYGILFEENVTYGFRRNLFGLRVPALILDGLLAIGCTVAFLPLSPRGDMSSRIVIGIGIAILHAGYMWFIVTEESVREAANQYARQLLLCCETFGAIPVKARAAKKSITLLKAPGARPGRVPATGSIRPRTNRASATTPPNEKHVSHLQVLIGGGYEAEDRQIMAAVARHVLAIIEGPAAGNVISLR